MLIGEKWRVTGRRSLLEESFQDVGPVPEAFDLFYTEVDERQLGKEKL